MENLQHLIGSRIRSYRKQKGMTQGDLAEATGLHLTYIGQLERGEKNATIGTIWKISESLSVPIAEIFARIPSGGGQRKDASIPELVADILCELKPEEQKVIYDLILTALKLLDGKRNK